MQDAFWHFADTYFAGRKPSSVITADNWAPDTEVMNRFKEFLRSKQVTFTDADFSATQNQDWMRDRIRHEFLFRAYNKKIANQASRRADVEVLAAIDKMPDAEALHKESNRAFAMRAAK
jgi:hypothetical protein